ncbi:MAG: nucleotidyltransferase family protein [Ruminococcaceae bacterium]|nr:nucleotidyltransferase family protein [Oscillospiraceae bacterium]
MSTAFIIAEYNPFHSGHRYQIEKTKEITGCDSVAIIMSGSMVQRCEPSLLSKWQRAQCAVEGGADIVFELPFPFSSMSANGFASATIHLANMTGLEGFLSFGSESGDIDRLKSFCQELHSKGQSEKIKEALSQGKSYANALGNSLSADKLDKSNDILAVEYLYELEKQNSVLEPITVLRKNAQHIEEGINEGFASASYIRRLINQWDESYKEALPDFVAHKIEKQKKEGFLISSMEKMQRAVLYKLQNMDAQSLNEILDISEGLEYRMISALSKAQSLDELYALIKTKRYTMSRIRRIVLFSFFEIDKAYLNRKPDYLKVLAFNDKGRELLKQMKKTATLPVITKPADGRKELTSTLVFDAESRATEFASMCSDKINISLNDLKSSPIYVIS